ncbi:hypothetical protein G6011_06920 [Alternaria panax]|uniref:Uncharacterized protein n=1 Tax=Alternaria panax TaxID=48097 RepID=A0AAD4F873_9PLEO|nr:hypothetical protein G6011_06920 [Alternaria panax]
MPFRDREWEELQRDHDIFPAYSDFIFGPDERLVVTQEPGLHPMIYPTETSAPVRYSNSMPSRSWSFKTAEDLDKSRNAAAQKLLSGPHEPGDSNMSAQHSGRTTPGLDIRSQIGSPLNPLLPPQGIRTVSEKGMARRKPSNTSLRRRQLAAAVAFSPYSPPQEQQSASLTGQQTQTRSTPMVQKSIVEPQQPSLLRSSSTTDIDENLAHMGFGQMQGSPSPFVSQATTLPPLADLPQQQSQSQPQRAAGPSNNLSFVPSPSASSTSGKRIPPLQPNDILHNQLYLFIHPTKRMEVAKVLIDRWNVVRNYAADNTLRAKAMSDIQDITMMINNTVTNRQAVMASQQSSAQPPQIEATPEREQNEQIQRIQHHQLVPQPAQVYAHPQLQPGLSSPHPTMSARNQFIQGPYSYDLGNTIPHASQYYQQYQQHTPQAYQPSHHQGQQQQQPAQQPARSPPLFSSPSTAQLRTNIDRHFPEFWQFLLIMRNKAQPPQYRKNAQVWMAQFKNSLPAEGREYLMELLEMAVGELREGRDALGFLKGNGKEKVVDGERESEGEGEGGGGDVRDEMGKPDGEEKTGV